MISSAIISQTPQADGSISVHERHTDHTGAQFDRIYMAPGGTDIAARMASNAAAINAELKQQDMHRSIFGPRWDYVRTHTTRDELSLYVRSLYKDSEKDTLTTVAMRVLEWVDNGVLLDGDARLVAGMTVEQWDVVKTRMRALVAAYKTIQTAVGE